MTTEIIIPTNELIINKPSIMDDKTEKRCIEIMEELFERKLIEKYSIKDYDKHFPGFERTEIKVFLRSVINRIQFDNAEKAPLEFDSIYDEMIMQLGTMLQQSDMYMPADKLKTILTMSKIIEDKVKLMDKFGLLDKIVDSVPEADKDKVKENLEFMRKVYEENKIKEVKKK